MKGTCGTVGLIVGLLLGVAVMAPAQPVSADKKAGEAEQAGQVPKKTATGEGLGREAVITANRIEFDNKEGVILFDENVLVDDEQFVMRSDRLLVFMEGTNDVQQLMAVGHVNITNESRSASCEKAVYTKKDGQIVMTGKAYLRQQGKNSADVGPAEKIVFWINDERMEVSPGRVVLPPGTFKKADSKLIP